MRQALAPYENWVTLLSKGGVGACPESPCCCCYVAAGGLNITPARSSGARKDVKIKTIQK